MKTATTRVEIPSDHFSVPPLSVTPLNVSRRPEHRETSLPSRRTPRPELAASASSLDGSRWYVGQSAQALPPGCCVRVSWHHATCSVSLRIHCSDSSTHPMIPG